MTPPSQKKPGRGRRALRLGLKIVAGLIAAVVGLAFAGAFVVANTAAGRRWLVGQINGALDPSLRGVVAVDGLDRLGLRGLRGLNLTVADERGVLLRVRNVTLAISPIGLLKGALFTKAERLIPLDRVTADEVYVDLSADAAGELRLGRAFESTEPTPPDQKPPKPTHIVIGSVRVGTIYARGEPSPSFVVHADASGLDASLDVVGSTGKLDLRAVHVVGRRLPRAGRAEGDLAGAVAWAEGVEPEGRGSFRGDVGGLPLTVEGRSERSGFVAARAEVPASDPERWVAIAPELPLTGKLGVRARAEGPRDAVAFDVEVTVDEGAVRARGKAGLAGPPEVEGRVEIERLSPRSFALAAPPIAIDGAAEGRWSFAPGGGGRARANLATGGGFGLPAAALEADVEGTLEALGARAKLEAEGARLEANAKVASEGGGTTVRGDARLVADALGRFPALGLRSGALRAEARGSFSSASGALDAKAHVEARGVDRGAQRVASLSADADLRGPAAAPEVGLDLRAAGVAVSGYRIGDSLAASARMRVGEGVSVEAPRLLVRASGQVAALSAASVEARGGRVEVRGAALEAGRARVRADARLAGRSADLRATCRDLDLAALARFVTPSPVVMGQVSCDVDAEFGPGGLRGEARVAWRKLDVPKVDVFDGELDLAGRGRALRLSARASSKHLGDLVVREAEVELGPGSALEPAAWERATGAASLVARVPLAEAFGAFAPAGAAVRPLEGRASLSAVVRRDDAARPPSVSAEIVTEKLALELPEGTLRGVDARATARFDARERGAYLGVELYDRRGTLARVEGAGEVPERLLRGGPVPRELALDSPFELSVQVPERRVRDVPFAARYARGDERVSLRASWSGSLRKPALDLKACLADVEPPEGNEHFALDVTSSYDGRLARLDARARTARRVVADVAASAEVSAADLAARGAEAPWVASATARFHDAPLSALPPVNGRPWGGRLKGEVVVENLRRDARARGWLVAENLRLGDAAYDSASLETGVENGAARALVRIRQRQGGATIEAEVPARWGRELLPAPDLMAGWRVRATARALRVALLGGFAPAAVADVDGVLDADASFEAKNGGAPTGEARLALRKGRAYVVPLGQGYREIEGRATLARDGRVRVEGLSARGATGRIYGSAAGRVTPGGDASIEATLRVPRGEPLPATFEGEALGETSGEIALRARVDRAQRRTELGVDVRSLYLRLSETSANDLQTLEPHADVRIGARRPDGDFAPVHLTKPEKAKPSPSELSADPSTLQVTINLGEVLIVRGTEVRVGLGGKVVAQVAEEMSLEGQIRLRPGGYFEVQGRRFRVESGTVSLSGGDVSDAFVVATASWDAPDGTKVFADFAGPVGSGRLTLRSEPARSPNEIVALLVFGTADSATAFQSNRNQGSGTGGLPVSAGGAIAAKGLNNALYRMTKLDVQTRLDTSKGNPRPEVVVPLSPSLSLEVSHLIGTPPPGQSPDRNFVALEWRFRRRWALETMAGDRGRTAVDAFWTYSY
ncbi:MAG TPA: translocation/assembly module TamB domain-containing protein [Polyangiaceae bacterium]|nr:translocation/assembly module TamB domain-containing protein [Polyangiaceae bacterium]